MKMKYRMSDVPVSYLFGGDKELAEDLVSEIFFKALRSFDSYDEKISRTAWITTIAKNHLFNYWRDRKITEPLPGERGADEEGVSDSFWLTAAVKTLKNTEQKRQVYELVEKLDPLEREIVTFHYLLGYSYKEIAEQKGATETSVKVASHRAIKKMRSLL
jgi:RNA polymerase sigma-70 factor (ECF subfamily)